MVSAEFVIPPSALPGISPSRGEIGWAKPLASTFVVWRRANNESISPLEGEMPGRAEGGNASGNINGVAQC
jgi:cobaltochelatase CobN